MSLKKRLRKLQGSLKQAQFIRKCGVPVSTMKNYLTGHRKSIKMLDHVDAISNACGITSAWVEFGPGSEIAKISKDDLLRIYSLDPEVIDVKITGDAVTPIVRAYDDLEHYLSVYCIHCGKYHRHGRGRADGTFNIGEKHPAAGHRASHCIATNSPFSIRGYILNVAGKECERPTNYRKLKPLYCPKCNAIYSRAFASCECGYINDELKDSNSKIANIYQTRITEQDRIDHAVSEGETSPQHSPEVVTAESTTDLKRVREGKQLQDKTDKFLREKFKEKCHSFLDQHGIYDFIAENYGEDFEGMEQFVKELHSSHASYRGWIEEKKQDRLAAQDESQKQLSVNGNK